MLTNTFPHLPVRRRALLCASAALCGFAFGSSAALAEPAVLRAINAPDAPAPAGGYSQVVELNGARRLVFISGQIPVDKAGHTPAQFDAQCRLVWANLEAQLKAAGMSFANLVKVTTYLSDRRYAADNSRIRRELLRGHAPALTVLITGIYDEQWHLEIEAVAAE